MKSKLQSTSNSKESLWIHKQDVFIASLKSQPLIILLRPEEKDFQSNYKNTPLFAKIKMLNFAGIKHIEIAWSPEPKWIDLIQEIRNHFPKILLGAASITSSIALDSVIKLDFHYAMTPIWDEHLQNKAREVNQVLIPGVFSPTEIIRAVSFGHKLIKFFPATTLGINYLQKISGPMHHIPFIIAAGGILTKDLKKWLDAGYNSVVLGRDLVKEKGINKELYNWLEVNTANL